MQGESTSSSNVLTTTGAGGYSMYASRPKTTNAVQPSAPLIDANLTVQRQQLCNNSKTITTTSITPMSSPFLVAKYPIPILPSAGLAVPAIPANNTVPEFLYQLTKMLTGGHKEVIEWSNGRIEVHNPLKLQNIVLSKYFRHSKFASFQRQLNYFGFRKIAGKGKMAPCSYVNDGVTSDIGSLLLIKRKTSATTPREKNGRKIEEKTTTSRTVIKSTGNIPAKVADTITRPQVINNTQEINSRGRFQGVNGTEEITSAVHPGKPVTSQFEIARTAVGKGVRHGYTIANPLTKNREASSALETNILSFPSGVEDSLSQLTDNFQNSLNEAQEKQVQEQENISEAQRYLIEPHGNPLSNQVIQPHGNPSSAQVIQPHGNPSSAQVIQPHGNPSSAQVIQPHGNPSSAQVIQPHGNSSSTQVIQQHGNSSSTQVIQQHGNPSNTQVILPHGNPNPTHENRDGNSSSPRLGRFSTSMEHFPGTLSRDSSLIELAMIPAADELASDENRSSNPYSLHFVDFPNEETNPSNQGTNFVD